MSLYRDAGNRLGMFLALCVLLYALTLAGRVDEGLRAYEEARALFDPAWPGLWLGVFDNYAALLFQEAGDVAKTREHLAALVRWARQSNNPVGELTALAILVDSHLKEQQPDRAAEVAREALALYRRLPDRYMSFDIGLMVRTIATALTEIGDLDQAGALYTEALAATRRNYGSGAFVLDDMAPLLACRGHLDEAARISAFAAKVYDRIGRCPRQVARRNRERLLELLRRERGADMLQELFDEGRRLSEDEACAMALGALDSIAPASPRTSRSGG